MLAYPDDLYAELSYLDSGLPLDYQRIQNLRGYSEGVLRVLEVTGQIRYTRTGIELVRHDGFSGGRQVRDRTT